MVLNLYLLSKYRSLLMGIAALMIIICHASDYGIVMPSALRSIFVRGGIGVDIFLFLSGLGCWFSLSKGINIKHWYCRRFFRIFIPYMLMQIPFCVWKIYNNSFFLVDELIIFSTLGFWLFHVGAWYVALLLPLYIFTPLIYKILQFWNRYVIAFFMIVTLIVLCMLDIDMYDGLTRDVLNNLQWAFGRVPSFVLGMTVAPLVKKELKVNVLLLIVLPLILYVFIHTFIDKNTPTQWCLVAPVMSVCVIIISYIRENNFIYRFVSWMGVVSLESYLSNIYLCDVLYKSLSVLRSKYSFLVGGYFEYLLVVVVGVILAYCVSFSSKTILRREFFIK